MRTFLSTVMIAAFALTSALGQQCETGALSASWKGTLRDSAELETRLGLGLVSIVETKDAVHDLVERGDHLLEAYAASKDGGDALNTAREAVLSATVDAVEAVRKGKTRVAAGETPPGGVVDPWAGVDQECGYFPESLGRVIVANGDSLPDVEQGQLPRLVPPRYRLAEALGLGLNRVVCEPQFIDPIQVVRSGSGGGVDIIAHLYCELTGHFVRGAPRNMDSNPSPNQQAAEEKPEVRTGEGAAEPVPPEETFRVVVVSRGRGFAGSNRTSASFELGKKKHYGVADRLLSEDITDGRIGNPWVNEVLPAAAAQRGWMIEPARDNTTSAESRVQGALREKLQSLKGAVVRELRTDAIVSDRLEVLRKSLNTYLSAIHGAVARDRETADLRVAAEISLRAINLEALVESGSLDDKVLRRIVPATRLALDAARRAVQVAKTPQAQRSKAAAVAETLNSLARWTLR